MPARSKSPFGGVQDLGAVLDLGSVIEPAVGTGIFLHEHDVPVLPHDINSRRGHTDEAFLQFDLFQDCMQGRPSAAPPMIPVELPNETIRFGVYTVLESLSMTDMRKRK